eukprot:scaffold172431_cov24-Tisochrysis_lutea.AAC.2
MASIGPPRATARATLHAPRKSTATPRRAPNAYCPASPPAPWQQGMAPKGQPIRFIAPTAMATLGCVILASGVSSCASLQTEMTEFSVVSGSCGNAAPKKASRHSSSVRSPSTQKAGFTGENETAVCVATSM